MYLISVGRKSIEVEEGNRAAMIKRIAG